MPVIKGKDSVRLRRALNDFKRGLPHRRIDPFSGNFQKEKERRNRLNMTVDDLVDDAVAEAADQKSQQSQQRTDVSVMHQSYL